jgi:hypothetical protein
MPFFIRQSAIGDLIPLRAGNLNPAENGMAG